MSDTIQQISTGYVPRKYQRELHLMMKRFNVWIMHRRFGKTVCAVNTIIDKSLHCQAPNPQYAYIAPNYQQAKRIAWDAFKWYTKDIPGAIPNEADLRIDIPIRDNERIRFMLLGSENPGSLKGIYLDGCIFDEFAECDPRVWSETVRPALSDRLGWANFMGTPKGQNHLYRILEYAKQDNPDWSYKIYKASETGIIPESELDAARAVMSEEEYAQEYECSFSAGMVGSYYGKLMEQAEDRGRITDVPYDPALPVVCSWDLGIGDTTAIWFMQQYQTKHHAIDYYEMSGVGLEHFTNMIKSKPYFVSEHLLPHDVTARDLSTGRARLQSLRDLGIMRVKVLPKLGVDDGISATRLLLPKVYFDKIKCKRGIDGLKGYQKKWDSKNMIFSDTPLHNWCSNPADSFRYYAIGNRDLETVRRVGTLPRMAETDFDIMG